MNPALDRLNHVVTEYLAGRMDLEPAARELRQLLRGGNLLVAGREAGGPPNQGALFEALFRRIEGLHRELYLRDQRATVQDASTWPLPADPACFEQSLEVLVEARDATRTFAARFRIWVCTAAWMERRVAEHEFAFGHGRLVVSRWDAGEIQRALDILVTAGGDYDWEAMTRRLERYLDVEDRPDE